MHEIGHLLGYEHSEDGLMAPVLSAGGTKDEMVRTKAGAFSGSSLGPPLSFLTLRRSSFDDVFSNLGRDQLTAQDDSGDSTSGLRASSEQGLLAAATARTDEEGSKTRVARRSWMQRYERELDA